MATNTNNPATVGQGVSSSSSSSSSFPVTEFQAGITACLRSWSALRTAVEGGWGGTESINKADDLRDNIYRVFNIDIDNMQQHQPSLMRVRPSIEIEDLEDYLAIYMEEEFSVQLEDNSERQVAQTIFQLYDECRHGKTSLASSLVQTAIQYDQQIASAYPIQVQSTEHDDDDDDDAMMDTTDMENSNNNAIITNNNYNNNGAYDSHQIQRQTPKLPVTTTTTISAATSLPGDQLALNAAEYAAQSLFGKPKKPKAPRKQQQEETSEVPMIDDDGFATVRKGRRKARS